MHALLCPGGPASNLRPRYNLAPSQSAAVVRNGTGVRRLSMLRSGLIPAWAKDPGIGHKLVNARAETASVKPAFRAAFAKRRCLVPADGFYDWRREGAALRGSLAEYRPGEVVETFTILTTETNATLRALHHRMPVILPAEAFEPWLSGEEVRLALAPEDRLAMHRVALRVNDPRNDDPECVVALASA